MSAANYTVNFGYKAQDGYYYGPSGIVGKYHRGNDRPCPTGTPIIISGVTIGLTGATGLASGPHLHTQACTAGSNYANDLDPGPYEFKNGTVISAGWHSQFGNHIVIRVGGVDITYAHLSKINVQVGQVIGDTLMIIQNADNWYWRMNKVHMQIIGKEFPRSEFNWWVGKEFMSFVEAASDSPDAHPAQDAQQWALANRAAVEKQIADLKAALANEQKKPPKEVIKEVEKIVEKEVIKEVPVYTHDQETKNMITTIYNYFVGQFKTFQKYIKK